MLWRSKMATISRHPKPSISLFLEQTMLRSCRKWCQVCFLHFCRLLEKARLGCKWMVRTCLVGDGNRNFFPTASFPASGRECRNDELYEKDIVLRLRKMLEFSNAILYLYSPKSSALFSDLAITCCELSLESRQKGEEEKRKKIVSRNHRMYDEPLADIATKSLPG